MSHTVLVVDDRAELREVVRLTLEHRGHTVLEAPDVETAKTTLTASRPDLVLLDIAMPGEDGWALIDHLRADGAAVPVIVVSAQVSDESAQRAKEAGCAGFLTKPFTQAELTAAVEAALGEG